MSEQTPKVFYIGPTSFLRLYVEKVVKRDQGEVFTHSGDEDPHYLIDDLVPDVVLLDEKFWELDWAKKLIKDAQIPIVLTGEAETCEQAQWPYLAKPYKDVSFTSDLMKLAREA